MEYYEYVYVAWYVNVWKNVIFCREISHTCIKLTCFILSRYFSAAFYEIVNNMQIYNTVYLFNLLYVMHIPARKEVFILP